MTGFSWRLPRPPLRASVALAVALGTLASAAGGVLGGLIAGRPAAHALGGVALFLIAAVLVVGTVAAHHPFPRFGPANRITLLRLALVALAAGFVGTTDTRGAWFVVAIITLAAVLDGVDGWLARRTGMASSFGARFDMETDALLILVLSVLVWQHDKAGAWVLLCGLMRYGFAAAGWFLPWLAAPLRSTRRGKTVAVAQLVGLGLALAPAVPRPVSASVAAVTLLALAWSFSLDVAWLARRTGPRSI